MIISDNMGTSDNIHYVNFYCYLCDINVLCILVRQWSVVVLNIFRLGVLNVC